MIGGLDPRVWLTLGGTTQDISAYVRSMSVRRGRSDELDRVNAATCAIRVDNRDGRFDPTFTSGAYGTTVTLGALLHTFVNIGSGGGSTSRDLFTGYVWDYPPDWPGMSRDEVVTLGATDFLGSLGRSSYYRNGGRVSETSGLRIQDVFQASAGTVVAFGYSDIDAGQAVVSAISATDAGGTVTNPLNALQHIQDAALTEGGLFYIQPNGNPRFEARENRQNVPFKYLEAIFGDAGTAAPYFRGSTLNTVLYGIGSNIQFTGAAAAIAAGLLPSGTAIWGGHEITYTISGTVAVVSGTLSPYAGDLMGTGSGGSISSFMELMFGEIPYQGLEPKYDDTFLTNEWVVTSSAAGSASAIDTASVDRYFRRSQSRETIGVSALELNTTANYLLGRYKAPALRFPTITVKPQQMAGTAAIPVMGLAISSRVVVKRRPPGGRLWRQDCLVEGVGYDITPAGIEVQLNLSPADMNVYWILGTHALDSTARVGY